MSNDEITNPMARRLHDKKDIKDAGTGKEGFDREFISKGKAQAPSELKEIDKLAKQYTDTYNAQRPNGTPELRAHPGRVYAGMKYAAIFEAMPRLEDFQLRVTVGLQPNLAAAMAELPEVETSEWWFQAYMDDTGFFWRNGQGGMYGNQSVVDMTMNALGDLVMGD